MGYTTRKGPLGHEIQDFWPDDTDTQMYIAKCGIPVSIQEILNRAQEKWGEFLNLDELMISVEEIQTCCLGYDLRDPLDYDQFLIISYQPT